MRPVKSFNTIIYTRQGCHLCDKAKKILQQHGLQPQMIDIDDDPDLSNRYHTCVPVVVIDGKERFRGQIDKRLLRRLLRAK